VTVVAYFVVLISTSFLMFPGYVGNFLIFAWYTHQVIIDTPSLDITITFTYETKYQNKDLYGFMR
jgi:hypothetical protein